MPIQKKQIETQIENLKTQTKLLEELLQMNKQYESLYGPIEIVNDNPAAKKTTSTSPYSNSAMLIRRSIC